MKNPNTYNIHITMRTDNLQQIEELLTIKSSNITEIPINELYEETVNHYILDKFLEFIYNKSGQLELFEQHEHDGLIFKFIINIIRNNKLISFDYWFFIIENCIVVNNSYMGVPKFYKFTFQEQLKSFVLINKFILGTSDLLPYSISEINKSLEYNVDNKAPGICFIILLILMMLCAIGVVLNYFFRF